MAFGPLQIFAFALVGVYGIAAALQGWMEHRLGWVMRAIVLGAGVACLWPGSLTANLAGVAGISIPCGFSSAGLPIGLQLQSPPLEEERLLRATNMYQQVTDWHVKRPSAASKATAPPPAALALALRSRERVRA